MNNKKIAKLRDKIVKLEDFFKDIAKELRKKTKIECLYFLILDENTGDFVTRYSTYGSNICLTKKELQILSKDNKKEIIFPETELKRSEQLVAKWNLLIKTRRKILLYKIHIIMPIYLHGKIVCLILFRSQHGNNWPDSNYYFFKKIKSEIEYCLALILFYNQTLHRVINTYKDLDECL